MNESDFQAGTEQGKILGKLESIDQRLDSIDSSFSEFRAGVGLRLEKVESNEAGCKLNVATEINSLKIEQKTTWNKIEEIADDKKWVIRIVMGAFILALIGFVFKK